MAVKASFEIRGLKKLLRNMKHLAPMVLNEADKAVLRQLEIVATGAKKITPVDTGTLRDTIHARKGRVTAQEIAHMVIAGPMPSDAIDTGPANEYAIVVHEREFGKMTISGRSGGGVQEAIGHKVGGPKYIERALDARRSKAGRAIGRDIRKAIKMKIPK